MTNLTPYNSNDGIEIYINTSSGESFCSIRGYARMAGVASSTVDSRVSRMSDSARNSMTQITQVPTAAGVRSARIINENTIVEWLAKDSPETMVKFAKIGVRMFLHQLAGYSVVSTAVSYPVETYSRRQLLEMALEAELKLEAQQQEIDGLVEQVTTLEPKAIAWDKITDQGGLIKLNDIAGALGIGRTTLTRKLVDLGMMYREYQGNGKHRNRAYAKFITGGKFVEKMTDVNNSKGDLLYSEFTTLVTKAGAEWIANKIN